MNPHDLFNKSLLVTNLKATSREAVLRKMAHVLFEQGFVKTSFADAIVDREAAFPTGLGELAIPHTDREHTVKDAIAVAVLEQPVDFVMMGSDDETTSVSVVFMLAISTNDCQIETLQTVMGYAQSNDALAELKNCADAESLYDQLTED
ncbi:PTS system galactitol-specific IIA component [Vibrio variabilis]|uniref:PTS system galactitol-specific IIA component n=1 Tax=Vibrio variabilis TaxID=990271 RepID=A0ABQ0JHJ3_9VIBR|nr:PTS system galactitol-specific IIA component [Vibrio variabilis]